MKINRAGIDLIKRWEGLRLAAYPDPATGGDPWTIGYGHTSRAGAPFVFKGMTITEQQASDILVADLVAFEAAVMRHLKRVPTENQFAAMVSLCFNIGEGNFRDSTVVRLFNAGDIQGASAAFANWRRAGGQIMPGLVNRRDAERALFMTSAKGEPAVLEDFTPEPKGTFSMTAEQIGAIVRTVVQLIAGLAIAKGIGDNELWMTIGGAAASLVSGIWSFVWIKKAST